MKKYEEVHILAFDRKQFVEMICDLCGKTSKHDGHWPETSHSGECRETTIKMRDGTRYPEGSWGVDIEYDICMECFETKLMPWLESQGAKPKETEYNY